MDYLLAFCTSPSEKIMAHEVGGYRWIDYGKILSDMPLLRGRTRKTVMEKIIKLENYGLIETRNQTCKGKPRKYIRLTPIGRVLIRGENNEDLDLNNYRLFIGLNVNDEAAKRIASDRDFLTRKRKAISRMLGGDFTNKAAALAGMYKKWLEWERDADPENLIKVKNLG